MEQLVIAKEPARELQRASEVERELSPEVDKFQKRFEIPALLDEVGIEDSWAEEAQLISKGKKQQVEDFKPHRSFKETNVRHRRQAEQIVADENDDDDVWD